MSTFFLACPRNYVTKVSRIRAALIGAIAPGTRLVLVSLVLGGALTANPAWASASTPQLNPVSLSFPTPQQGYVLSLYDCTARTCAALQLSSDHGASWSAMAIPGQLNRDLRLVKWGTYGSGYATLSVHFADLMNGWIYGTVPAPVTPRTASPNWVNRLWSTHDGGKKWSQVRLPLTLSGGVIQMSSHAEETYLFGASFQSDHAYIFGTPSGEDNWQRKSDALLGIPAGGGPLEGSFTFAGDNGWFVAGNDRGFTATARLASDGSWRAWSGPSFEKLGASYAPIDAVTGRVLLAEVASGGFVYPPTSSVPAGWNDGASWLFISYDAGATFKPFRKLSSGYQGNYYSTVPGLPASPTPGTILTQHASNSTYRVMRSTNWGRTWSVVLKGSASQVLFTTRTAGIAIVDKPDSQLMSSLFRTSDSGSQWSLVHL
jgi:hypothetical protein